MEDDIRIRATVAADAARDALEDRCRGDDVAIMRGAAICFADLLRAQGLGIEAAVDILAREMGADAWRSINIKQ